MTEYQDEKPIEEVFADTASPEWTGPELTEEEKDAYNLIMSWSPEERQKEEKALVFRLDCIVTAPILICYILNYLDRNSIAQARVSGLNKATHITQNQYSLVNGIFYISYVLFQTPANMILAKTKPSLFIPGAMIAWAVVSAMTSLCHNLGSLIAVRFVLGIVEAPFYPGAVFYLTSWFTRKEIGRRISILVSGICLSNSFAGLISAGILSGLEGKRGIAGWQWIFIVEGAVTVFVALLAMFIIPNYPHNSRARLSAKHRMLAQMRLDQDIGEKDSEDVTAWQGLKMAIKDYRTWCYGSLQWSITVMISFNFFYPTILQGLGITNTVHVLLLTVPPYFTAFAYSFLISWAADRTQKRTLCFEISTIIGTLGLAITTAIAKNHSQWAKYAITFILAAGSFGAYACAYPWLASNMPRPAAKRACAIGIANSLSNAGAFVSGYIYYAEFGPSYQVSWGIATAFGVFVIGMVAFLGRQAKKRNEHLEVIQSRYESGELTEQALQGMEIDEKLAAKTGYRMIC